MGRADRHPRLSTDLPGGIWGPISHGICNMRQESRGSVGQQLTCWRVEPSPPILCRGLGKQGQPG